LSYGLWQLDEQTGNAEKKIFHQPGFAGAASKVCWNTTDEFYFHNVIPDPRFEIPAEGSGVQCTPTKKSRYRTQDWILLQNSINEKHCWIKWNITPNKL
jgi:hypothetical protein